MTYRTIKRSQLLSYIGIFLFLLISSYLLRNEETVILFTFFGWIIRLSVIAVPIYFYYKKNYTFLLCYLWLIGFYNDVYVHIAAIIVTIILFNKNLLPPIKTPFIFIYLLFFAGLLSFIIGLFRENNLSNFVLSLITFYLPTLIFGFGYNYYNKIDLNKVMIFLNKIILMGYLIIIIQAFVYGIAWPDVFTGGTAHPHFFAVFMSIALFYSLSTIKDDEIRIEKIKKWIVIAGYLPAMYLIDAKYILIWVISSLLITILVLIIKKPLYKISFTVFLVVVFFGIISLPKFNLPLSHIAVESQDFKVSELENRFSKDQKAEMITNIGKLAKNDLPVFLIGAGPGTFLSQASNILLPRKDGEFYSTLGGQPIKLPGWMERKPTWLITDYAEFFLKNTRSASAFTDWRSSYLNMIYENGLIGLSLYLLFFTSTSILTFKKAKRSGLKAFSISVLILFLLLPFLELWAEYYNYQIISMTLIGIITAKSLNAD